MFKFQIVLLSLLSATAVLAQEKGNAGQGQVIPITILGQAPKASPTPVPTPAPTPIPTPVPAAVTTEYLIQVLDLNKEEDQIVYQNSIVLRDMTKNMDSLVRKSYQILGVNTKELTLDKQAFCFSNLAPITGFAEEASKTADDLQKNNTLTADVKYFAQALFTQSLLLKNFCTSRVDSSLGHIPTAQDALDTVKTIRSFARANKMIIEQQLFNSAKPYIQKIEDEEAYERKAQEEKAKQEKKAKENKQKK